MADTLHNPTVKGVEDLTLADTAPRVLMSAGDPAPTTAYQEVRSTSCYEAGYREATTWDELVTLQTAGTPTLVCSALTVGASVTLDGAPIKFTPTGSLDLNGFTLILTSVVINPDNHQIFTNFSPGDVSGAFGSNYTRNPDWFGADSGLGNDPSVLFTTEFATADDSAPGINAALQSFPIKNISGRPISGKVELAGTYKIASKITVPEFCHLEGVTFRAAILYCDPDAFVAGDYVVTMGDKVGGWNFETKISNVYMDLRATAKEIGAITWIGAKGEGSSMRNLRLTNFPGASGAILNTGAFPSLGFTIRDIIFENQTNPPAAGVVALNIPGGPQNIDVMHVTTNASPANRYQAGVRVTNAYGVSISYANFEDCVDGVHCLNSSGITTVIIKHLLASTSDGAGANSTDNLVHLEDATAFGKYDITDLVWQVNTGTNTVLDDGAVFSAPFPPAPFTPGVVAGAFSHFKYQRSGITYLLNEV